MSLVELSLQRHFCFYSQRALCEAPRIDAVPILSLTYYSFEVIYSLTIYFNKYPILLEITLSQ